MWHQLLRIEIRYLASGIREFVEDWFPRIFVFQSWDTVSWFWMSCWILVCASVMYISYDTVKLWSWFGPFTSCSWWRLSLYYNFCQDRLVYVVDVCRSIINIIWWSLVKVFSAWIALFIHHTTQPISIDISGLLRVFKFNPGSWWLFYWISYFLHYFLKFFACFNFGLFKQVYWNCPLIYRWANHIYYANLFFCLLIWVDFKISLE
mgnify:CR=1 FL=1